MPYVPVYHPYLLVGPYVPVSNGETEDNNMLQTPAPTSTACCTGTAHQRTAVGFALAAFGAALLHSPATKHCSCTFHLPAVMPAQ
jgi:hypothetical protein